MEIPELLTHFEQKAWAALSSGHYLQFGHHAHVWQELARRSKAPRRSPWANLASLARERQKGDGARVKVVIFGHSSVDIRPPKIKDRMAIASLQARMKKGSGAFGSYVITAIAEKMERDGLLK